MPTNSDYIFPLDIKTTLSENRYNIPIYQRNYAWEAKEIEQLIQDITDYAIAHPNKYYYIGTLVVASKDKQFDTIDGQQRLTTLSILTTVIHNEFKKLDWFNGLNIRFASRHKSMHTLDAVYNGDFQDSEYEPNIKAAYDICKGELKKLIDEQKIDIEQFISYLYQYVQIVRVQLPDGIDLNHYFEIMNSRGEQLEKHEVLKSTLMSFFQNSDKREIYEYCFNLIWEACSNMEKYVQYGFTTSQRHLLFGTNDWNELVVESFDELVAKISTDLDKSPAIPESQKESILLDIDQIILSPTIEVKRGNNDDQPDRFNSVVNFQNFLLHVLKIQTDREDVSLNDKDLLDMFNLCIPVDSTDKEGFAKQYIYNLLKCKFLFDKYIIKREFIANTNRWALKSLKWYSSGNVKNGVKYVNTFGEEQNETFDNENRRILLLLSMFHVSIPSMSYKYWLYASLRYVCHQTEVESGKYIAYLEHIAKSFVFDNYLAQTEQGYYSMININLNPIDRAIEKLNLGKLRYGSLRNNLVFNFIDYLLWLEMRDTDPKIKQYEFTPRSSVEHYYPQHPINDAIEKISETYLHSIGNLCLISHEKNSRLNNHTPKAKQDYYATSESIDSIKQYLMMQKTNWSAQQIVEHEEFVIALFERNLNSAFNWEVGGITKARKWFKLYKQEDKILLIRALMCFGRIDFNTGWTAGMEKYNLYQWDRIEKSDTYEKYVEFVTAHNPNSLNELIDFNIRENEELRADTYRYTFVTRPYILKYCKEGNFGWSDNGKYIVLVENSRATEYQSCDLYCYSIKRYLYKKYKTDSYCGLSRLKLFFNESENGLTLTNYNWESTAYLEIWNNKLGYLCYELNTRNLHGNSRLIKYLKEQGWVNNNNNRLYHPSMQYLVKMSKDVEDNIVKAEHAIEKLLKKLQ